MLKRVEHAVSVGGEAHRRDSRTDATVAAITLFRRMQPMDVRLAFRELPVLLSCKQAILEHA